MPAPGYSRTLHRWKLEQAVKRTAPDVEVKWTGEKACRVYPAVDVTATSTRKEELLLSEFELNRSWVLRRILNQMGVIEGMEFLQERMQGTESNEEFLKAMND